MRFSETGLHSLEWRKAQRSMGNGECVEVVVPANGSIFIRDSTDRYGPVMQYSARSWRMFIGDAKEGQFDLGAL